MMMMWKKFYDLKQQPNETAQEHYKQFKSQVKVVESVGGTFGVDHQLLIDAKWQGDVNMKFEEILKAAAVAKQKYLACKFIYNADHAWHGHVKDGSHLDYNKDYDKKGKKCPETVEAAHNLSLTLKAK